MNPLFFISTVFRKIYHKVRDRVYPYSNIKPESERDVAILPKEGVSISVETALNSRCTGDYDEDPRYFHWGIFDRDKKLTAEQIDQVVALARTPRFTDGGIETRAEKNILTFIVDNRLQSLQRDWAMVECGMQHQAVGLVCAALGAGYAFNDIYNGGKAISDSQFASIQIKLNPIKPSYDGSYWSNGLPVEKAPWKSGNLPNPTRLGEKPLISTLAQLKTTHEMGRNISTRDLGQLLWAARGRTPHYHMSEPWGMTIPTYHGKEAISEVFVISDEKISKYVNWEHGCPTHSLEMVGSNRDESAKKLANLCASNECLIVLGRNLREAIGHWEIGYQLLNLMLQASSLNLMYSALLLDDSQKKLFEDSGINDPVAALLLKLSEDVGV